MSTRSWALSILLGVLLLTAARAEAIILPSCQNDCRCSHPCSTKCVDDSTGQLMTCDSTHSPCGGCVAMSMYEMIFQEAPTDLKTCEKLEQAPFMP